MADDITPEGVREADTLLLSWLLVREAERSGDADAFLAGLDAMLSPVLRTRDGFTAFAHRLELARALLAAGRTDPLA